MIVVNFIKKVVNYSNQNKF